MDKDIHLHLRMAMLVVDMVSKADTVSRADMGNNRVVTDSKEDILGPRMVGILARTMDILLGSTMDTMVKDMGTSMGMGKGMEMATTAIKGSSHDRQVERM